MFRGPFIRPRKVELLEDINDDYYNIHYKKGTKLLSLNGHPAADRVDGDTILLNVHGYGAYTYARKGQWKYIN